MGDDRIADARSGGRRADGRSGARRMRRTGHGHRIDPAAGVRRRFPGPAARGAGMRRESWCWLIWIPCIRWARWRTICRSASRATGPTAPGTYDMKGGAYVALHAYRTLVRQGRETALPITFLFTTDEEMGQHGIPSDHRGRGSARQICSGARTVPPERRPGDPRARERRATISISMAARPIRDRATPMGVAPSRKWPATFSNSRR